MKKIILFLISVFVLVFPLSPFIQSAKAEPVSDYSQVLPIVKIQSYKLARNHDIYQTNSASATIISPDGLLLTNSHVVLDENYEPYDSFAVCLTFNTGLEPVCEYTANLLAEDKNLDLALLRLSATDNRGTILPELPYYNYDFSGTVAVGELLNIFGYSDIGGKNLTQTMGQVSGFDNEKGISYIKTDADISSGNSGGTALDAGGNFVGVPTYVVSSIDNLGYVLDIKEARSFIEANKYNSPVTDQSAYALLKNDLNVFNDAKDANYYEHPYYPKFAIKAGSGWQFNYLDQSVVSLLYQSNEGDKNIFISSIHYPFKIPQDYIDEWSRKLSLRSDDLANYSKVETTFAGYEAYLVNFNQSGEKMYYYYIPYGYAQVEIMYSISLDHPQEDFALINNTLDSFSFLEEPNDNPPSVAKIVNVNPNFSLNTSGEWKIQPNEQPAQKDLIAVYHHSADVDGGFEVSYERLPKEIAELDNKAIMEEFIKENNYSSNYKLINKDDAVVLDNFNGWSITYSYAGSEQDKTRKASEVYLRDGQNYVYKFVYDDLADNYDKYLGDFKNVLRSFTDLNQPEYLRGKGIYALGTLDYLFVDIKYHRFEQAITNLADKKVISGYDNGTFRPEKKISSQEAISYLTNSITESKRANVNENGASFLTGDAVTLKDVLQAIAQVYNLNIWQDQYGDAPAWKPYLDKGYELYLLPRGVEDPDQLLTRAEFAYILNELLDGFKD